MFDLICYCDLYLDPMTFIYEQLTRIPPGNSPDV